MVTFKILGKKYRLTKEGQALYEQVCFILALIICMTIGLLITGYFNYLLMQEGAPWWFIFN